MELLIALLLIILRAMNFSQYTMLFTGNPTVQQSKICATWEAIVPALDGDVAAAAAASTMFDAARVKWVQTALNVLGAKPLRCRREIWQTDHRSCQQFQQSNGLAVDGWAVISLRCVTGAALTLRIPGA
jgi:hypothetical protein